MEPTNIHHPCAIFHYVQKPKLFTEDVASKQRKCESAAKARYKDAKVKAEVSSDRNKNRSLAHTGIENDGEDPTYEKSMEPFFCSCPAWSRNVEHNTIIGCRRHTCRKPRDPQSQDFEGAKVTAELSSDHNKNRSWEHRGIEKDGEDPTYNERYDERSPGNIYSIVPNTGIMEPNFYDCPVSLRDALHKYIIGGRRNTCKKPWDTQSQDFEEPGLHYRPSWLRDEPNKSIHWYSKIYEKPWDTQSHDFEEPKLYHHPSCLRDEPNESVIGWQRNTCEKPRYTQSQDFEEPRLDHHPPCLRDEPNESIIGWQRNTCERNRDTQSQDFEGPDVIQSHPAKLPYVTRDFATTRERIHGPVEIESWLGLMPRTANCQCSCSQQRIHGPGVIQSNLAEAQDDNVYLVTWTCNQQRIYGPDVRQTVDEQCSCSQQRIHGSGVIQSHRVKPPYVTAHSVSCGRERIHGLNTEDPTRRYSCNTRFDSPKMLSSHAVINYAVKLPHFINSSKYGDRWLSKNQSPKFFVFPPSDFPGRN